MIVFDLRCSLAGHIFEAWFGSTADYESQRERGLLTCPLCGDSDVEKAVMAPNVASKGNRKQDMPAAAAASGDPKQLKSMLMALAKAQAHALKDSDWVGSDFTDRARAMHLGEIEQRSIHGQATPEQAKELIDEGVEIAALPLPVVPPGARN